jgi:hypothetical protein
VGQIENENEISIEAYMRTLSTIELKLKIAMQDHEEMEEEVLMQWDRTDENWINKKISGPILVLKWKI